MFNPEQPLPKPLSCQQNWNDMLPHDKGRICLGCGKLVTDFRNKSWSDIEKAQRKSPLPLCGLYSEEQFNNWGKEIHATHPINFSKWLKYSAVFLSFTNLFPSQVDAQTKASDTQVKVIDKSGQQKQKAKPHRRIIRGTVVKMNPDSTKYPLRNVNIIINHKSVKLQTKTDSLGIFKIDITNKSKLLPEIITLVISHPDYPVKNIKTNQHNVKSLTVVLTEVEVKGYAVPLIDAGTGNVPYYGIAYENPKPTKKDSVVVIKSWWKKLWKK